MPKFEPIRRNAYTMASVGDDAAEITMYGEIVAAPPVDWWTGEPIPGDYIVQDEFLADLENAVGAKKITLRMNSLGGDAGVSILIHNRLREFARDGAELTCIVDGVAMSGGSLIMCACDHVQVNPASLIMIHKCWGSICGGYNADELRALAKTYDAWDDAQITIYTRKTGLTDTVVNHMMAQTTYMTGKEAVEKGFADELIEDAAALQIAASADRTALYVNGRMIHMAKGISMPESIPTVSTAARAVEINTNTSDKGGTIMATNLEELRHENEQLASAVEGEIRAAVAAEHNAAVNEAVEAERRRLSEIDEISCLYDEATVREAKYGTPCTAQEMAFRAATQAAKSGAAFMRSVQDDYAASGAKRVQTANANTDIGTNKTPEQRLDEAKSVVKNLLGKK